METKNFTKLPYDAPEASLLVVRIEQTFLASEVNTGTSSRGFQKKYDLDETDDEWGLM